MKIRFANKKDYEKLCSFYKRGFQKSSLKNLLNKKDFCQVVIAIINKNIVGKCLLYTLPWTAGHKKDKRAIISEVFVKEEWRRQGIAEKMINFCINKTKSYVEDIQIDRVELENKPAINLYKKKFSKQKLVFSS